MTALVSTLPNGFRVASETMPSLKSAALAVYIMAGGRHERPDQNGIAHFIEHMAFKGTTSRSAFQISETIERVGGYLNAYTARETTAYLLRVLEDDVPLAIDLVADIILNSAYAAADIELERNVILHEIAEIEDSPEEVVFEALQEIAYPDQPFGRPIAGTAELVKGFKQDDLKEFVSEHYAPECMVLAAAGAVDHDRLVVLAGEYFGSMKKQPRLAPQEGKFSGGESRQVRDTEQAQFTIAFEAPNLRSEMDCAARVYSVALGGGTSSRLFVEARERRALCYSVSAQSCPSTDTGTLVLHASTSEEKLCELANLCMDEMSRSAEDLTDEEVARAQTQIRVGTLMAYESPMARIERLGSMLALLKKVESIEESIERFDSVTTEQVRSSARQILSGNAPAMALCGPVTSAPTVHALKDRLAH